MRAEVIRLDREHPDEEVIRRAGKIILDGGLVAFPTETVYGLGGNALDGRASEKIYAAKGRPSDNPLIVHIADREALAPLVTEIPPLAAKAAEIFWPGPMTMILPRSDLVPLKTTGGLPTVAVRFPSDTIACALIRASGGYVAAPSANTSGRPSPTLASHVMEDLGEAIPLILDGGEVPIGLESTILDFTEEIPVILRPGYYSLELLRDALGEVRMDKGLEIRNENIRPKAPGMKYRHYAPKAELIIVEGARQAVAAAICGFTEKALREGRRVGILASEENAPKYGKGIIRTVGSLAHEETIAHHLYDVLREFDHLDVDVIYSEAFYTPKIGQAIMNRLLKAAGHRVIKVS